MTLSPLWLLASGGGLLLIGLMFGFWFGIANERTEAEYKRDYLKHAEAVADAHFDAHFNAMLHAVPPDFCFHPHYHPTRYWTVAELIGTKIVEVSE